MSAHPDDIGLEPWTCRTAEPTGLTPAPQHPAAHPSVEGLSRMSWGQLRDALIAEHGARQLAELQRDAVRSELKITTDAHTIAIDDLIAKRDECDALRAAVGMAENVIATLRARVAELEALAAGPRVVPTLCRDCGGDGVANGTGCGTCGGEGCRS